MSNPSGASRLEKAFWDPWSATWTDEKILGAYIGWREGASFQFSLNCLAADCVVLPQNQLACGLNFFLFILVVNASQIQAAFEVCRGAQFFDFWEGH